MAEEAKSNSRTYKVLRETWLNDTGAQVKLIYENVCHIEASSPTQAIRLVVEDKGAGAYIAIPQGNWSRQKYGSEPQPPKLTLLEDGEPEQHSVKAPEPEAQDTLTG